VFPLYATWTMSYVYGFRWDFRTRCFDLRRVRTIGPNFTAFLKGLPPGMRLDQQPRFWLQQEIIKKIRCLRRGPRAPGWTQTSLKFPCG
jgi:hypothetical protein